MSMSMLLDLPALRFTQGQISLLATVMSARDLLRVARVHTWDSDLPVDDPRQGYQRAPVRAHYAKVAKYLRQEGALLPTCILLSSQTELDFTPLDRDSDNGGVMGCVQIRVSDSKLLNIVDGQHRVYGIRLAGEADPSRLDIRLPVIIVQEIDRLAEILQFYVVNTTAKRIRTDLAARLMAEMSSRSEDIDQDLIGRGRKWQVRATNITHRLNTSTSSPWRGLIKPPNADKDAYAGVAATEASFSTSLKPVLTGSFAQELPDDKVIKLLEMYWEAIKQLIPEAFASPKKYALQKTPGLYTMHMIAPRVFELWRNRGDYTVTAFKAILASSDEAAHYFDADYWLSGEGDASRYNSMGAFRQLADEILQALPEVSTDIPI